MEELRPTFAGSFAQGKETQRYPDFIHQNEQSVSLLEFILDDKRYFKCKAIDIVYILLRISEVMNADSQLDLEGIYIDNDL